MLRSCSNYSITPIGAVYYCVPWLSMILTFCFRYKNRHHVSRILGGLLKQPLCRIRPNRNSLNSAKKIWNTELPNFRNLVALNGFFDTENYKPLKLQYLGVFSCLPPGFLPVVGPTERWWSLLHLVQPCYVALGQALICGCIQSWSPYA